MSKHLSNHQRKLKIKYLLIEVMLQSNITLQFQCFKNLFDVLSVTFINELRSGQCNKSDLLSYQNHFFEQILCKKKGNCLKMRSALCNNTKQAFFLSINQKGVKRSFGQEEIAKKLQKISTLTFYFSKSFTNNICFWSLL